MEKRAFKQAVYALRNDENALDAVQDAMMKLVASYASRPADEWPMLFQRILQNAIHDQLRRQKVRSRWVMLLSALGLGARDEDGVEEDPLERMQVEQPVSAPGTPHGDHERRAVLAIIEQEVSRLPARQREAFMMRYWEEMDIAETAEAMGCSEGSVKTHCSRATHTLAAALRAKGVEL